VCQPKLRLVRPRFERGGERRPGGGVSVAAWFMVMMRVLSWKKAEGRVSDASSTTLRR
jgi:hypothetical protein